VLIPRFFSRAAEEIAKARNEKVDAEMALEKASDKKEEEHIDIIKFAKDVKYRKKMLGGKPSVGEQRSVIRPSNKLMETKFGDNWLVEPAIELQLTVQEEACSRNQ
jgi:hypothetical protein